ncbi:MAG: acyl-CoA mutase large subunit family protein [Desulfitobacteriaceae bacterium]
MADKKTNAETKRWEEETLKKFQAKKSERKKEFITLSNLERKRLYLPDNVSPEYMKNLGYPGEYPFTRGVYPNMYRGQIWTHRQIAGFGTGEDTNGRFRFLLSQGQTGLSVDFDYPTLVGYDSDNPKAEGEVGKVGVAIDSLSDMDALFHDIPLDQISISMTINFPAPIIYAMYIALAEKRGIGWEKLAGTIQFDLLKEYIGQKSFIFPPRPSMKLIRDVFAFASKNTPRWNFINVSGYHIREAGSTAVQELAFTLGAAIHYIEEGIKAGLAVDDFAPRMSFFFSSQIDFFEEIAKFRAARRLWARLMKDRFGAKKQESMRLRFHAQTACASCTARQPLNNIIRTTTEAMSAVLGGTQSLHCNGYDETLGMPSEHAMRIALRTQQIIAEESGVADTVDPLAGSYYIEELTDRIEQEAMKYIEEIDQRGGYIQCIEDNYFQQEVADAAYAFQRLKETGELVVVGVNKYQIDEELTIDIMTSDPESANIQMLRTKRLKETRDNLRVNALLADIKRAATDEAVNIVPIILEAVKADATEGDIIQVLKEVYGEYQEKPIF